MSKQSRGTRLWPFTGCRYQHTRLNKDKALAPGHMYRTVRTSHSSQFMITRTSIPLHAFPCPTATRRFWVGPTILQLIGKNTVILTPRHCQPGPTGTAQRARILCQAFLLSRLGRYASWRTANPASIRIARPTNPPSDSRRGTIADTMRRFS